MPDDLIEQNFAVKTMNYVIFILKIFQKRRRRPVLIYKDLWGLIQVRISLGN